MKNTLSFILGLIACTSLFSQSPTFSIGAGTYTNLTGATRVMKDSVWDDPADWAPVERDIPLGFSFRAFGKTITSFVWEQAGISYKVVDTVIYIGFKDLDMCDLGFGTKTSMSPISMKYEGTAGFHIVKLEWRRFGLWDDWNQNGKFSDSGYVQLWIYENPNKVELHFGKSNFTNLGSIYPGGIGAIAAKYDKDGRTSGIKLNGQAMSPTVFSFDDTGDRTVKSWPEENTVYSFSFGLAGVKKLDRTNMQAYYDDGNIIFSGRNYSNEVIEIYNQMGMLVSTKNIIDNKADMHALLPGIYIAKSPKNDVGFLRFIKLE